MLLLPLFLLFQTASVLRHVAMTALLTGDCLSPLCMMMLRMVMAILLVAAMAVFTRSASTILTSTKALAVVVLVMNGGL